MSIKTELQSNNIDLQNILNTINNLPEAGAGEAYAAIGVTYPSGSTCTCVDANGTTIEIASNSDDGINGYVLFLVDEIGTYTITATATDGSGDTASKTVEIATDGQSVSVELSYKEMYYDYGTEHIELEPIKDSTNTSYGSVTENENSIQINPKGYAICIGEISSDYVDLSGISTLACKIANPQISGTSSGSGLRISVCETKTRYKDKKRTDIAVVDYTAGNLEDGGIYTLDVSAVSGGYIGVYGYGTYSPSSNVNFELVEFYGILA